MSDEPLFTLTKHHERQRYREWPLGFVDAVAYSNVERVGPPFTMHSGSWGRLLTPEEST